MALETGLISAWNLNETSGNAADSKGSNTLVNHNTVTYAPAKIGNGAFFTAGTTNNYLDISDASQTGLDFSTAMTIAFWFKRPTANKNILVGKDGGTGHWPYIILIYNNGHIYWQVTPDNSNDVYFDSTQNVDTTNYHFFIAEFSALTTLNAYMDNAQLTGSIIGTIPASLYNSSGPFALGGWGGGGLFSDGSMDTVNVWNRLLLSAEKTQLWNGGAGMYFNGTSFVAPSSGSTNFFQLFN